MKKNKKSSFWSRLMLTINVIAIVFLLISYLAAVLSPEKYWYIAFLGLAYPFILLANILFLAYWLLKKKWYALLSFAAILIGYDNLTSTIGFRTATHETFTQDSSSIRLMTYNVHYFKQFGADLDSTTRKNILQLIDEEQPDVLGFQEFFTRKKGKYHIKDSLFKIMKSRNYHFLPSSSNDYESTGIAVFSKLPIVNKGNLTKLQPDGANNGVWIDLKKDDKIFRVHVVHLASISFAPEDYGYLNRLKNNQNKEDEDLVHGKRILSRLKNAFIRRGKQVDIMKSYTDSCKTPYVIMGDFNDTPASYTVNQIGKNMKNTFKEKGSGLGITYNGEFPNFQIDYILTSPEFDIQTYKIIKKPYSDHYPVRVDVRILD